MLAVSSDRFKVASAVHPDDHIFNFVISHPGFKSDTDRIDYYFADGARSARQLDEIIKAHFGNDCGKVRLLEFASGYGCVGRHLIHNSALDLTASDIHPEAIRFMKNHLGIAAIQSHSQPEMLTLPHQYDVVFALSFFSHMPIATWARWLVRLVGAARIGGLVVFTTHGAASLKYLGNPTVNELGFHFQRTSEQKDLPLDEYGNTVALPPFVKTVIGTIPQVETVLTREGYWWDHQDLYVLRKTSEMAIHAAC
jgi:hypothetical protein